jgi:hypothetical protein
MNSMFFFYRIPQMNIKSVHNPCGRVIGQVCRKNKSYKPDTHGKDNLNLN